MAAWTGHHIVVFVGPSFPGAHAHEFVPSCEIRPPIRRGDLSQIESGSLVAIIDGVFDAERSVSPREIRTAVGRGVRIVGASSMGALRAAEVPQMLGVGRIYEMYKRGVLKRDDEVAILLNSDTGQALTEPLVNIRFAVDTLVRAGSLDGGKGTRIVEAASALHFSERTYPNIMRKAGLSNVEDATQLATALASINLKYEDAQTLLERLVELGGAPHWDVPYSTPENDAEHRDHFASAQVSTFAAADASLLVWEFGEDIAWWDVVDLLAITGQLDCHARRVLARLSSSNCLTGAASSGGGTISVQELFRAVMAEWGWTTAEEVHVTLNDLGIGFEDLQVQLRRERATRKLVRSLISTRDPDFMRALRVELLTNNLALKRAAMRFSALRGLADAGGDYAGISESEIEDAKRAVLCERAEMSWHGLLDESGMQDVHLRPTLVLIARARRTGVRLLDTIEGEAGAEGPEVSGTVNLPSALRTAGNLSRSIADERAAEIARGLADAIGISRIAQLGELERFGLHVAAAYRASQWSSTIGSGKSESLEGAITGAIMEELEKHAQERFEPAVVEQASFRELVGPRCVDPSQCALPFDTTYMPANPIEWAHMSDLITGDPFMVPRALLSMRRGRNDVFYSARRGGKVFSTNGLASGFTITEALLHATCERVERHAVRMAELLVANPGHLPDGGCWPFKFLDLASCPESSQRILERIRVADYEVRVMDITCEVRVPTFTARIFRVGAGHGIDESYSSGSCAHPNPEVALNRALLEAVQSRITAVSGAREDFALSARSLGRHERPRPLSAGEAYWIRPYVPKEPWAMIDGLMSESAREDLDFVLRRLTAAGFEAVLYRDLSLDGMSPASVVRIVVPGMEDTNPFHTGLRARTLVVQDLMRRHQW